MPNSCTFSIPPIRDFVKRHIEGKKIIVDPFARNSTHANITNDLNPETIADYHMPAIDFLSMLVDQDIRADAVLFDPPYSPRQVKECYAGFGRRVTQKDTQSLFYSEAKQLIRQIIKPLGVVLSFGWNSMGVGKTLDHIEVLMVYHGGAHNDTICVAQRARTDLFSSDELSG